MRPPISTALNIRSFDPGRAYFEPYGLTCVYWQASSMGRPDYHNEIELNFLTSGSVTYLYGGQRVVAQAGRLAAFWAAIPHQIIDFSRDTEYLVATIPLHSFLQWRLPEGFVQPLMQGQFLSEPTSVRAETDSSLLQCWERDLRRDRANLERPVLLEMQARMTRMALNCLEAEEVDGEKGRRDRLASLPASGLSKVERMACFIMKNYTRKITVREISECVGLNPNYAMNLFRMTFGTTLIHYLTQHRVSHAQRLLATTELSVTEVALQSGFSSISRFNEAFHLSCGCSPRDYRKGHQSS